MNIFILDEDPKKCAQAMIDKHVVKMITEHVQIISTVYRQNGFDVGYKSTHVNHPCTLWAGKSTENLWYLINLTTEIHLEYLFRYGIWKTHGAYKVMLDMVDNFPYFPELPSIGLTPFAQAMPEQYKVEGDAVTAYRNYYMGEKRAFATWKTHPPEWWK